MYPWVDRSLATFSGRMRAGADWMTHLAETDAPVVDMLGKIFSCFYI